MECSASGERDLDALPAFGEAQDGWSGKRPRETGKHLFRSLPVWRCGIECLCQSIDVPGLLFGDIVVGAK